MTEHSRSEAVLVLAMDAQTAGKGRLGGFLAGLALHSQGRRVYLLLAEQYAHSEPPAADEGLDVVPLVLPMDVAPAVQHGIAQSDEERLAVLDAGRHDPKALDALFAPLRGGADLVVGRCAALGPAKAQGHRPRAAARAAGCAILRLLVPCRGVRDPLAGCFALRRAAWQAAAPRLQTAGASFLLDFLAAAGPLQAQEVPVACRPGPPVATRLAATRGWHLLVSIARGALPGHVPRRWLSFAGVGALGTVTDAVVTGAFLGLAGQPFGLARTVGLVVGMSQNYLLNNALTFTVPGGVATLRGWALFGLCQTLGTVANWGVSMASYGVGAPWLAALALGTAAGLVLNFATASRLVWRAPP